MCQKVQKTVEAPRMWYMNTIVDMLEMKRQVPTTQTRIVCDMVSSSCLEVDVRRSEVNEILATIRHDRTVLETNVEESKAKIVSDTDQAVYALK